ncbi:MAG: transposase [Pseudobdellovibrionaceae bacterium]
MKQPSFGFMRDYKKEFGGRLLAGKRKTKRPLSHKAPIHLILKADQKGIFSPSNQSLAKLIRKTAHQFNIQIFDLAINWSHIHFLIRIKSREDYIAFIRALTSLIAQGVKKSKPQFGKIFTLRPFTRILKWGRDLKGVFNYLKLNQMESFGLIHRSKAKKARPNVSKRPTKALKKDSID